MKKWKFTGEKAVNLFLLALSVFYLSYSLTHYKLGTARMPKEGFLPMLLGVGAVLLSAYLTAQAFANRGDAQNAKFPISWLRFAGLTGISLFYALTLTKIGYLIDTFAFLFVVLKLARVDGWVKPLVISALTSVVFYVVFKVALGVMLPAGFLGL